MYESIKAGSIIFEESGDTLSDGTSGGIEENSVSIIKWENENFSFRVKLNIKTNLFCKFYFYGTRPQLYEHQILYWDQP